MIKKNKRIEEIRIKRKRNRKENRKLTKENIKVERGTREIRTKMKKLKRNER